MPVVETATLQLPKDLIDGAVKHHVALAISEALGTQSHILETAVQQVLNQHVNSDGKISSYSSENKYSFISVMVNITLRNAVIEALNEEMVKHKAAIKKALASELSKSKSKFTQHLIETMASSVVEAAASKYRLTVSLAGE